MKTIILSSFIILTTQAFASAAVFDMQESMHQLGANPASPYPPVVAPAIRILPYGFDTITVGNETYYYVNGIFYQKVIEDQRYTIVPPPIGATVTSIPQGYQYLLIDGTPYYVYQGIYYKRILDGYKVEYPPLPLLAPTLTAESYA